MSSRIPLRRRRFLLLTSLGSVLAAGSALAPPVRADTLSDGGSEPSSPLIYIPQTGHHLDGPFLGWWLQHGRERVVGWPISEPWVAAGRRFQFFERGLLAQGAKTPDPSGVQSLRVGRTWLQAQREGGVEPERVDRLSAFWFYQTGFGVHPEFWPTFRDGGGAFAFGYPISPGLVMGAQLTQVFERARLLLTDGGSVADDLGAWQAPRWQVPTDPVEPAPVAEPYGAEAFAPAYGSFGDRWADVDLTTQTAVFYVGDEPVHAALISSGRGAYFTPAGTWEIWRRVESAHMIGGAPGTADYYNLRNVYFTQYFTPRYVGFHYAYWHDAFGTPQSHGCVNMRLEDARWTWHFLGEGSRVRVRY